MAELLLKLVEDHKVYLPVYTEVANPALNSSHWREIFRVLEMEDDYQEGMQYSVSFLVGIGVIDHLETIATIGAAASKQYSMLKALENMIGAWDAIAFHCTPYKSTNMYVLGQTEEVQMLLDDQLMKIQAMNASPFVKPFEERAKGWERILNNLQVCHTASKKCRSTWTLLALSSARLTEGGCGFDYSSWHCGDVWCVTRPRWRSNFWTAGSRCSPPGCTWSQSSAARTS